MLDLINKNELCPGVKMKIRLLFIVFLQFLIFSNCASQRPVRNQKVKQVQKSLDSDLQNLTDQIIVSLSQTQKSKIAVIEFSNLKGDVTNFGKYLAEELITRLFLTNRFEVIERQLLNKVIKEHSLNLSGLIDISSAQEIGRILGVDAIASGSVTDLGNSVKVNARLISTQTGKIFSVASVTVVKDNMVRKLMNEYNSPVVGPTEPISQRVPSAPLQKPVNKIVTQGQFTFELKSCKMEDRKMTCSVIITNDSENDIKLSIVVPKTKFFDESGNEYPASTLKLANSVSGKSQYRLYKLIIPDVPTAAKFIFENISSSSTKISLLNLLVENGVGEVKFRNIPLQRSN